ncbi:MAG: ATP-binding cassette domain-containing protein [Bacteroidia bacterium]|nr:ATP-binding cassette domain-containing protein [Bacteroidia bacterium]
MDISVKSLSKNYGTQKAVDNISFEVKTGEIVGFLGPNGAGKTTTMKMITAYMSPSSGTVKVGDYDVNEDAETIKPLIGYLPENNPLYLEMPVLEYLSFVADIQGVKKTDIPSRVRLVVDSCGLNREKHKKIQELSKGYRQRVGLAQALIHDPDILVLDEPTTGLDPNQIVEIRNLIRKIGKEKTVLLSTHILPEVEATCDRILIIKDGKIVADGTAQSLKNRSRAKYTFKVMIKGEGNIASELRSLEGVIGVEYLPNEPEKAIITAEEDLPFRERIFNYCVEKGHLLLEMTPEIQSLEDIFRDLTLN